ETMGGPYRGGQSGGVADAVLSVLSGLKDKVTGRIGEIADKFGEFKNSELAKMALAVPRRLLDGAVGWLTDAAGSVFDKATGLVRTGAAWVGAKVGAFSKAQLDNAATIISVARKLGFGDRGAQIALMTALQESTLRNINYGDRDSIGLFQQRRAWGTNAERMNPATAASMFFTGGRGGQPGLNAFDWQNLPLGVAAQKVQVSAFPDAYAKWADEARKLVAKFDNGGWLAPGHLAYNGSRSPELVVPRDRVGTGGVVNLNIRLDGSWNDDRAVGRLVRAISDYERRRGSVLVTRQAPATRTLARGHPEGGLARSLP
ncbi:MAG: hypothetical protein J2P34_08430, partial [Actinobacteria bacterium]|nr:hypothetical protein [Actinomycetota bacterium]